MKMQEKKQITLREWIAKYKNGEFTDNVTRESLITAGWLDWMSDLSEMAEYNIQIGEFLESIIDDYFLDTFYVYFKEVVPADNLKPPYIIIHLKPFIKSIDFDEIMVVMNNVDEGVDSVVYTSQNDVDTTEYCTNELWELIAYFENVPLITLRKVQSKTLPEGWIWCKYDDNSGHLKSPNGEDYFSYDMNTGEYKITPESSYDFFLEENYDIPGGYSIGGFQDFVNFAEKYIKENVLKNHERKKL
jgi:hypothetical protein